MIGLRTRVHLAAVAATCFFALLIVAQGVRTRSLARNRGEILAENEKIRSELRESVARKSRLASPERVRVAASNDGMIQGVSAPR